MSVLACISAFVIILLGCYHYLLELKGLAVRLCQALTAGCVVVSGIYIANAWLSCGGFCTWCSSIATAFMMLATFSIWMTPQRCKSFAQIVPILVLTLLVSSVAFRQFLVSQVGYPSHPKKIYSTDPTQLFSASHQLNQGTNLFADYYCIFVDFECRTCRELLKTMLTRDVNLFVHSSRTKSEYHRNVCKIVFGLKQPKDRATYLRHVLNDESYRIDRLQQLRESIPEDPVETVDDAFFEAELALCQQIKQRMSPVVIVKSRSGLTALSSPEIEQLIQSRRYRCKLAIESFGTANHFQDFLSDGGLTFSVGLQSQVIDHLACIIGRCGHGGHSRTKFRC